MNGPLAMYRARPIVRHDLIVNLPDCMYRMKNIHAPRNGTVEPRSAGHVPSSTKKLDISDQVKQFLKNNQNISEMAALEIRQEQILQQLAELKKQMNTIKTHLKINHNEPVLSVKSIASCELQVDNLPNVVINASPTNPPYSLQIFQKLWQNHISLTVKSYLHSTVNSLSEGASSLTQSLENFIPTSAKLPQVNVTLIWKNVEVHTELIVSKTKILGEINILRYLARLSNNDLNYEHYPNPNEIDSLLDTAFCIVRAKTKTERASLLQILNKSLGKSQWLAGRSQISVADLAAYSALKQSTGHNEINVNMGKWYSRCETCSQ